MLVVMKAEADPRDVERVCQAIRAIGLTPHPLPGRMRTAIGMTGNTGPVDPDRLAALPGVVELIQVTRPYKLTGREMQPDNTIVRIGLTAPGARAGGGRDSDGKQPTNGDRRPGPFDERAPAACNAANVEIGGPGIVVIAGPCSVETHEQTLNTARCVKGLGANLLRGGAYKPRTSPYAFQGLGPQGLDILAAARDETGLPVVSEVVDVASFDTVEAVVDMIQIGARNMQNYSLLKRAGRSRRPVLLKRAMAATLKEFLLAAEYIMSEGNPNVVLCERGIRSFSDFSRFTLDLTIVPELKRITHLPVIVDPSHAAGRRELVIPLARAAIAVGADGVIVEVHPEPEKALSDGPQALTPPLFEELMDELRIIVPAVRRGLEVTV